MYEGLIPLFAIFFVFGAPVAAWVISRVLAHQERMEMIRNGFVPPPDGRSMRNATRYGQMPPPPPSGPIPPTMQPYTDTYYAQAQMRKGITVTLIGFAILIGLSFIGEGGRPGPWLLGGLIPMFVGIAQIINAVLNGASIPRIGNPGGQHQSSSFGPRPVNGMGNNPPPPNQPPPAPGPYAWRPGSTPEIEKPAQPPDNR